MNKKIKVYIEGMRRYETRDIPDKETLVEIPIAVKNTDILLPEYMGKHLDIYI